MILLPGDMCVPNFVGHVWTDENNIPWLIQGSIKPTFSMNSIMLYLGIIDYNFSKRIMRSCNAYAFLISDTTQIACTSFEDSFTKL
jgi:hypothetical protein